MQGREYCSLEADNDACAETQDSVHNDLDDFAFIASHDLKEPLRGISAYCEILLEDYHDKLDPAGQRRLQAILGMSNRLAKLIENLMNYSRIGCVPRADADVDLNAVIEQVVEMLRPVIDERGGEVRLANRLPKAAADANLLGMVFSNLISNGLKFNESPRPSVEIGTLATDPATIYVRDNGIGIAPEHQEAVFALFRRLHSQKKYEGTGAGLTIVRKIVESYGGRVWLESEPGRGSTFYVALGEAISIRPESPQGTGEPIRTLESPDPTPQAPHWLQLKSEVPASG
jgi:light-regulated signal transduction histidine kinase (bacteriophytochrome)